MPIKITHFNLLRDAGIVVLSIAIAAILSATGALEGILSSAKELRMLASFLSGIFFVFIFTTAPSVAVLVDLLKEDTPLLVAVFAGLGAVVGDVVIFRFIKSSLTDHILEFFHHLRERFFPDSPQRQLTRVLLGFLGAVVIASPFPDEIGLLLLGLSEIRLRYFIALAFILNFLGILALGHLVN